MTVNDVPPTRIDWVEAQIRHAILDGELAPGERLITAALSERFSVSPTPLREALQRLSGEGLVEFAAQRGARVTPLSTQDRIELAELRTLVEPETATRAAQDGSPDWLVRVRAASETLLEAWGRSDPAAVASELAYRAFYEEIAAACPSTRLRTISRVVRDQESRYRLAVTDHLDREILVSRHVRLVAALAATDLDRMRACIKEEISFYASAFLDRAPDAQPTIVPVVPR